MSGLLRLMQSTSHILSPIVRSARHRRLRRPRWETAWGGAGEELLGATLPAGERGSAGPSPAEEPAAPAALAGARGRGTEEERQRAVPDGEREAGSKRRASKKEGGLQSKREWKS